MSAFTDFFVKQCRKANFGKSNLEEMERYVRSPFNSVGFRHDKWYGWRNKITKEREQDGA